MSELSGLVSEYLAFREARAWSSSRPAHVRPSPTTCICRSADASA